MTNAQTEARAVVTEALPPHEQAILGHDAVTVLTDLIATALAAKDAELAAVKADYEKLLSSWAESRERHLRAEAQFAEANKALEPLQRLADAVFRDGMNSGKLDDAGVWGFDNATLTYGDLRAARRALEAQGGE